MIPRILHHVWPGEDPIPDEYLRYIWSWSEHHPGWEHNLWTTRRLHAMGLDQEPTYRDAERHAPHDHLRFRADVARLEVLFCFGGVYVDTDVECLRPIDPLLEEVQHRGHSAFAGVSPNSAKFLLTNAVMGATIAHRWLRECLRALPYSVEHYKGQHIARMVGPHHVTRAYRTHGREVLCLPARYFFPQSIAQRERGEEPDLTQSYGYHRWASTRDKRWPRKATA